MLAAENLHAAICRTAAAGRPVFILDDERRCIASGCAERLAVGELIDGHIVPVQESGGMYESSLYRRGCMYCVRFIQAEGMYFGEILGANELSILMQLTDGMRNQAALYSSLEYELSQMWENKHIIERLTADNSAAAEYIHRLEKSLYRVNASSRNMSEYMNMMCSFPRNTVVDITKLCKDLAERCNSALIPTGRHIELISTGEKLYIRANARCALAAILNAVQNALLYSPKDSVPVLDVRGGVREVHITVRNENALYPVADCEERTGGIGIPIIRRFAALTESGLSCELDGSVACVTLDIPEATEEDIGDYSFEEEKLFRYEDGLPDYIQLQMALVADRC